MALFSIFFLSSSDSRKLQKKQPKNFTSLGEKATEKAKNAMSSAKRLFKKSESTGICDYSGSYTKLV